MKRVQYGIAGAALVLSLVSCASVLCFRRNGNGTGAWNV